MNPRRSGGMADAADSKSADRKVMRVRIPPPAPPPPAHPAPNSGGRLLHSRPPEFGVTFFLCGDWWGGVDEWGASQPGVRGTVTGRSIASAHFPRVFLMTILILRPILRASDQVYNQGGSHESPDAPGRVGCVGWPGRTAFGPRSTPHRGGDHEREASAVMLMVVLCAGGMAMGQTEWVQHPDNPVIEPGDPGPWDDSGPWIGAVILRRVGLPPVVHRIHTTDSDRHRPSPPRSDGVEWTMDPANPVLTRGGVGDWDLCPSGGAAVIHDGTQFHMWYAGSIAGPDRSSSWSGTPHHRRQRRGPAPRKPRDRARSVKDPGIVLMRSPAPP